MTEMTEYEEILDEVLTRIDKVMAKPDVPSDEIYKLMNQLSAYASRLRVMAITGSKEEAKQCLEVAKAATDLVGTLKYQARQYRENQFNNR